MRGRQLWAIMLALLTGSWMIGGHAEGAEPEKAKTAIEGHWKARIDRLDVMLVVSQAGNTWGVRMVYFDQAGRETGVAHGTRFVFANGRLTYERVWDKKPIPTATENSACGLTAGKDDLEMAITHKGGDRRHTFRRMSKAEIAAGRPVLEKEKPK